jgi:hypothetical protein
MNIDDQVRNHISDRCYIGYSEETLKQVWWNSYCMVWSKVRNEVGNQVQILDLVYRWIHDEHR